MVTSISSTLVPLWGMVGMWSHKFGFHSVWEFWYVGWRRVWGTRLLMRPVAQGI